MNEQYPHSDDAPEALSEPADGQNDVEQGKTVRSKEINGRDGPEPTRYGDWEKNGRCIDF